MRRMLPSLLMLSLLFFAGCSEEKKAAAHKTPPPLSVETITVSKQQLPIWLQYTGTTKASSEQEVRARVSGRLEAIYFKDGESVKKGQPLFKIEQTQYRAALDAAKARKARDIASLKLAKADVDRYLPLVKEGLAPRATLEQYQARYAELKAQILADDAQIESAKLNLDYTIVTAPISGRASARRVDVGNLVGYGESTLLTTIVKMDPIYVYFNPPASDAQRIAQFADKTTLDAFVELKGDKRGLLKPQRLNGFVDFANNTVDPLTSTITMRASIANPDQRLLPGTFVYINVFITDKISLLMVPPQAVYEDQLSKFVYIDANGTAQRRNIKTGFSTRFYTVVSEGLKDGEHLIINGLMKLRPGVRVNATDVTQTKGMAAVFKENHLLPGQG